MAKKKQIELTIEEKLQNALVPKEEQPYKIPNNWCWTNFVVDVRDGTHDTPKYISEGYPLITSKNLKNNNIDFDKVNYISKEDYEKINLRSKVDIGDVLFSMIGTIGNPVLIKGQTNYAIKNVALFKDINLINMTFFRFYLETKFVIDKMKKEAKGSTQKFVSLKYLRNFPICYPSLEEQQRIVNRIESLFAKLDRAKELIENTLAQFEQNKMAILHKAFTGELTAKWRKENNIDLSSWEKIKLGKVLLPMQTKKPTGQFLRYIDIDAIDNKRQIVKAPKLILTEKAPSRASRGVETGNILFSMVRPYLKNIAQIDSDLSDCIASTGFYVCRCKPELNSRFLYYLFIFDKTIDYLMQFMKGDNSPSIRKDDLLNMKIDLPTIEEQQEIVNILDNLLAKYNKIKNLEQQLEKIELLKKAILAKAFRGELGTNNPDEESAENLLKEILAEK